MENKLKATLLLQDGSRWEGEAVGSVGVVLGQIIVYNGINTTNIITNPTSNGAILVLTAPKIGYCGVNTENAETGKCTVSGIVTNEIEQIPKHWRSAESLDFFMKRSIVPGIRGLDVEKLANHIQKNKILKAAIVVSPDFDGWSALSEKLNRFQPNFSFSNAVKVPESFALSNSAHVGVCDFGSSKLLAQLLRKNHIKVTILPPQDCATIVSRGGFDGLIIGNGSGKPRNHPGMIESLQSVVELDMPVLGVGSGCGFIAAALKAKFAPLAQPRYGDRIPVKKLENGRIYQTHQMRDYTIVPNDDFIITYQSVIDGSPEGFIHKSKKVIGSWLIPQSEFNLGGTDAILHDFTNMVRNHMQGI